MLVLLASLTLKHTLVPIGVSEGEKRAMNYAAKYPTLASFLLAMAIAAVLGILLIYSMPPKF